MPARRAARVLLLDPQDRVLLLHFAVWRGGALFRFWATPGGGVEPGESDLDAARRELREELGLEVPLTGPVHAAGSRVGPAHDELISDDVFFLGRCAPEAPVLSAPTEAERAVLQDLRWWTAEELAQTPEPVFPADLPAALRRLARP
ncbi:MAG: NUDIX domain-containing protein [Verrucomicrobium sp.]|nr:NUDIX domain-containing protein [Verrucomicrobium sp.]